PQHEWREAIGDLAMAVLSGSRARICNALHGIKSIEMCELPQSRAAAAAVGWRMVPDPHHAGPSWEKAIFEAGPFEAGPDEHPVLPEFDDDEIEEVDEFDDVDGYDDEHVDFEHDEIPNDIRRWLAARQAARRAARQAIVVPDDV